MQMLDALYVITLISAAFSLGGLTNLVLLHRTAVLRSMLLFLLSLFLISLSFYLNPGGDQAGAVESIAWLLSLSGSALNVAVLPALVSSLTALPIGKPFRVAHAIWTGLFILGGLLIFLAPALLFIQSVVMIMQLSSIAAGVGVLTWRLRSIRNSWWYRGLVQFVILSGLFLLLLGLDMAITLVPIPAFSALDRFSLPVYLIAINVGSFFFSVRYLSRGPLVSGSELTGDCISFYQLTPREAELITIVMEGASNKEIAERLFISAKTVENHLYNVYQKFDVGSRTQLIHVLQTWKRD
jgi:DNA-binding CsgD family transcriptional regulator